MKRKTNKSMSEQIVKAYTNLADKLPEMGYEKKVQVIIKMRAGAYIQLMSEMNGAVRTYFLEELPELTFVELYGLQTPIIIDNTIPEDIDFAMQLREDYERDAHVNLSNRLFKMFGGK